MAWSKITSKNPKPIGWWYHKICCEYAWYNNDLDNYYKHLRLMHKKYRINLHGEKLEFRNI